MSDETTVIDGQEVTQISNAPKIIFERNEFGLLKHINYHFSDNGYINWRKMINKDYLAIKREKIQEGKTDPAQYEDKDLLILLAGLKELAQIRGYNSVSFHVTASNHDFVSVTCEIDWVPNYETENRSIQFQSTASCTLRNTDNIGSLYMMETAENRAFARCIRNFLKISIVSKEEMAEKFAEKQTGQTVSSANCDIPEGSPHHTLQTALAKYGFTFEQIKASRVKKGEEGADKWEKITDIPVHLIFGLLGSMAKAAEKKPKTEQTAS